MDQTLYFRRMKNDEPTFLQAILYSAEDLWLLADLPETKSCAKQVAASDRVKNWSRKSCGLILIWIG